MIMVIDVLENDPGEPSRTSASVGHHAQGPGSQLLRFRNSVQSHPDRRVVVAGGETVLETM